MVIKVVNRHNERVEDDCGRYKVVKLGVEDQTDHENARLVGIGDFTAERGCCCPHDPPLNDELTRPEVSFNLRCNHFFLILLKTVVFR